MRTTFRLQSFSKFVASRQATAFGNRYRHLRVKTKWLLHSATQNNRPILLLFDEKRQTRIISIDNFNVRLFPGERFKAEDMSRIRQIEVRYSFIEFVRLQKYLC